VDVGAPGELNYVMVERRRAARALTPVFWFWILAKTGEFHIRGLPAGQKYQLITQVTI
jgi:hypothetical protein